MTEHEQRRAVTIGDVVRTKVNGHTIEGTIVESTFGDDGSERGLAPFYRVQRIVNGRRRSVWRYADEMEHEAR
jgi:hypothetical protein